MAAPTSTCCASASSPRHKPGERGYLILSYNWCIESAEEPILRGQYRGSGLLRNVLHGLADDIIVRGAGGQVAERNHADQALVLVQHRQPPDLASGHQVRSLS